MPVQFICPNCQKLLSVGSRKVGCQVNCPKCASSVVVPPVSEAAAAVATARAARERLSVLEVPLTELTGFEETPELDIDRLPLIAPGASESGRQTASVTTNGNQPRESAPFSGVATTYSPYSPAGEAAGTVAQPALPLAAVTTAVQAIPTAVPLGPPPLPSSTGWRSLETEELGSPRAELPPLHSPAHREMIMISRVTLYVQAVILFLVTGVAFAVGYAAGRGSSAPAASLAAEAAQPVVLDGKLTYTSETGDRQGDEGAVVIALPAAEPSGDKLPVEGLHPADPPDENTTSLAAIQNLGGAYGRANEAGGFSLIVPQRGRYRVLLISGHAHRPADADPLQADLEGLARYFADPARVIGQSKYRWSEQDCQGGIASVSHHFGADGQ